ncbi:Peptidase C2, calpain, domain III [Phytophthora cactorum]|nr:Peptidase C2, calpain, domain III [Phytophthora cactorum]
MYRSSRRGSDDTESDPATAHVTPVYASAAVRPVAEEEQKKEEKPGAARTCATVGQAEEEGGDVDETSDYAAKCGHAPVMIAHGGVNPLVVKQDIVTDCSFVASLCIAAAYEQRFQKRLITNIIFPADPRTKQPVYNPFGNASSGQLLSSCTTRKNELWVSLIEKAYLKLNGGYDFPGGNSGIDLFALTGWIPERVPVSELIDAPNTEERLWEQLKSAFHYGDCIITMSTGISPSRRPKPLDSFPCTSTLCSTCPYSRHDKTRWDSAVGDELRAYQRQFYASEETESEEAGGQQDDGLFWIDFESVKQYFESLYMNWNPELFPYKGVCHEHWPVELGPVNDSLTLGFNPQYSLTFCKTGSSEKEQPLQLDHAPCGFCFRGINNPHTLVSLDLDLADDSEPCFTLVASQYEKFAALDYTLSIFSTRPFTCEPIPQFVTKSPTSIVIPGAWDSACAGGRPFYSAFMNNPQFHLQLQKPCRSLFLFLETEVFFSEDTKTASFPVNLRAALHTRERVCGLHGAGNADSADDEPLKVLSSGEYRPGFCFIEVDAAILASGLHDVVLIPSTFEQGVLGKFTLRVVSDPPAGASIAYRQIPSEGHGMELTRLRGKWDTQTGSAAGCSNYGCYTFNPTYLVHVIQECDILARLVVLEPEADAAPGESPTEGDSTAPPSINVSVFESTSEGDLLLSTNPKLAFAGATSARGVYVSGAPSGVLAKATRRFPPGWYIVLPSTFEPQELSFELRIYASAHVDRLRMDVDQRLIKRLNIQRAAPIRPKASNVVACMRECMKTFESGTRDQQTQFLMSGTCSDVRFEDHIGREYILEQWADFACFLNEAAPMLEHCEFSADILDQDVSVGHVSALLVLRPTRRSLATLLPHCFSNMRLRDRMLQSPSIRLPMTVLFQFDEQDKVCRYAPTIDFVTGLYAVIRDYRDVASILESANINASGQIRGGLSSVAMSQVGISYCGDNGHYRTETEPSCPRSTTSHVDKLSVGFPFSSDEDTRPS